IGGLVHDGDVCALLRAEKRDERKARAESGGRVDVQDAVGNDASIGGKTRGEEDDVGSESLLGGKEFGGDRAAAGGVDFLEDERAGRAALGALVDGFRGVLWRKAAGVGVERLNVLRRGVARRAEPYAYRPFRQEGSGGVAGPGEVVGDEVNLLRRVVLWRPDDLDWGVECWHGRKAAFIF